MPAGTDTLRSLQLHRSEPAEPLTDVRLALVTQRVILGYTAVMKTAISMPDETFERASRRAGDLGMSRSEFFARAAQHYLDELDAQSLTGQIDNALEHLDAPDDASADAIAVSHRALDTVDNEW